MFSMLCAADSRPRCLPILSIRKSAVKTRAGQKVEPGKGQKREPLFMSIFGWLRKAFGYVLLSMGVSRPGPKSNPGPKPDSGSGPS
jgi:hypothetical protein